MDLTARADLDGKNVDMPIWFQIFFVSIIVVIIALAIWTFLPVRRKSRKKEKGPDERLDN